MKIVILHNEIKSFRAELFSHLEQNFNVNYYCLRKNKSTLDKVKNVCYGKYIRIPKMQDLELPLDLWKFLKKQNPDVIISTDLGYGITYIGFIYSKIFGKKFVLWNEQWCDINHPRRWLTRPIEKLICKKSDYILAFGKKHGKYVENLSANANNVINMPNAVPSVNYIFSEDDLPNYPRIKDKQVIKIVCPGRLVKFKGQKNILQASLSVIKQYPNVMFYFLGDGPERDNLIEESKRLGIENNVHISAHTYDENTRNALFSVSDLTVLASVKNKRTRGVEAWGLVVNEAVLFRNKIIVSDATGVAGELIVNNVTGGVYRNNNVEELSALITSSFQNPAMWDGFATAAQHKLAQEFSMQLLIAKFSKFIVGLS